MRASPLNYFTGAAGPAALPTMHLGWALAALSLLVCLIIGVLLLGAIVRRRPVLDAAALGAERGGMRWITIGTGISTLALLAAMAYVLATMAAVVSPPRKPALTITVTAYDWWWRVVYESDDPARRFTTANEIHIPVGQPVHVLLKSADVIHAFWVPQLAGKTQTIPGQQNEQWLQADRAGVYRGQCTQYCGLQHAHMAFEVIAEPAVDYARWASAQAAAASPQAAASGPALRGRGLFEARCAGCHTVRGSAPAGMQGPDLTHLATRRMLAAGTLDNTPENLALWISHAQRIKPGALMPDMPMSVPEAAALTAYLETLH